MVFHGLFGKTLSHSISPELHKEIYKVTGYDAAYKIMEFQNDELENAVNALKILKIKGVNVTIPYKEKVLPFLDFIDEDVKNIGAVNTISLKSEKLYGYNTDCYGFGKMIEDFKVLGKNVTVIGYGGASKSVIYHLLKSNVNSITIVSRKAFELKKSITNPKIKVINYEDVYNIKGDVIVNTTPIGMYPDVDKSPVDKKIFKNYDKACDLIYNPKKTRFLKDADSMNLKTENGLKMLIYQAIKSVEIWREEEIKESDANLIYENFLKYGEEK